MYSLEIKLAAIHLTSETAHRNRAVLHILRKLICVYYEK
jgi:hypothetical protein